MPSCCVRMALASSCANILIVFVNPQSWVIHVFYFHCLHHFLVLDLCFPVCPPPPPKKKKKKKSKDSMYIANCTPLPSFFFLSLCTSQHNHSPPHPLPSAPPQTSHPELRNRATQTWRYSAVLLQRHLQLFPVIQAAVFCLQEFWFLSALMCSQAAVFSSWMFLTTISGRWEWSFFCAASTPSSWPA